MTTWGCVVLTMGRRPESLRAALASLLDQRDARVDVVVVGNAWEPAGLPDGVRGYGLSENVGIPAGRNAGVPLVGGDLLFFLDDDAEIVRDDTLAVLERAFAEDPRLGLVQLRVVPSDGGAPLREWDPRLRPSSASGDITAVWEGAVAMRRSAFDAAGGWPGAFRFVHEGVDLGWGVMDAGYTMRLRGDLTVRHPTPMRGASPARHGYSLYHGARNRVWIARRRLPVPLAVAYVLSFAVRSLPRLRSRRDARAALRGYRDGLRQPCGERRPLRRSTIWRMTRAGRPPVI